jgi:hypothetical protein
VAVANGRVLSFADIAVSVAGAAQVVRRGARREDTGGALSLAPAGVVILAENDITVWTVVSGR